MRIAKAVRDSFVHRVYYRPLKGLSRVRGNFHARFLGEWRQVTVAAHPTNIVEQVVRHSDHRFIKKITRPMLGFKSFASAEATLAGIELHHIIRKEQLDLEKSTPFEQFYTLAG